MEMSLTGVQNCDSVSTGVPIDYDNLYIFM